MHKPLVRKIAAVVVSLLILGVAYWGNFLPMRKSQLFISAMGSLQAVSSVDNLISTFKVPFNATSPIGQEELVRNSSNVILGVLQQTTDPQIIGNLMDFVETAYHPIVVRGTGMSFEQNLYILGTLNELAFIRTNNSKYFTAAKNYYSQGLILGPKRPQFLYGMFDVYRIEGNVDGVKKIADQILSQWPNDERTRSNYEDFLSKVVTAPAKK